MTIEQKLNDDEYGLLAVGRYVQGSDSTRSLYLLNLGNEKPEVSALNPTVIGGIPDTITRKNGSLLVAYLSGADYRRIIDASTAKELKSIPGSVESLAMHNGKLLCGTGNYEQRYASEGKVIEVESGRVLARRDGPILALVSHKGILYDATFYQGFQWTYPIPWISTIRETSSDEVVAQRKGWLRGLLSFDGTLYDYGVSGLFNTFSSKKGKYPLVEGQFFHCVALTKELWNHLFVRSFLKTLDCTPCLE